MADFLDLYCGRTAILQIDDNILLLLLLLLIKRRSEPPPPLSSAAAADVWCIGERQVEEEKETRGIVIA